MTAILDASGRHARLPVASLRGADELTTLATADRDTFTPNPKVAEKLFADKQTAAALAFGAAAS